MAHRYENYNDEDDRPTEDPRAKRISTGLLVCISIPSVLVTIGFGIWAVVIWNMNRMNQTDDTSCKSRSILEILLAVGIIDIIQGSLITIGMCFSIMAAYRQNAFTSNLERCFSFIRSMAGLSTFVLAIVLSVFVWGSNCNTVKNGIYTMVSPFLIAYWAVVVSLTVCSIVLGCCVVCCGVAVVALFAGTA